MKTPFINELLISNFALICTMYQEAGSGRGVGGWETKAEMEVDAFLFACP